VEEVASQAPPLFGEEDMRCEKRGGQSFSNATMIQQKNIMHQFINKVNVKKTRLPSGGILVVLSLFYV
jgi:hypothetical protein